MRLLVTSPSRAYARALLHSARSPQGQGIHRGTQVAGSHGVLGFWRFRLSVFDLVHLDLEEKAIGLDAGLYCENPLDAYLPIY